MIPRRALGAVGLVAVAGALLAASGVGLGAEPDDDWDAMVRALGEEISGHSFTGTVVVERRAHDGTHTARAEVTNDGGLVEVDAVGASPMKALADESHRYIGDGRAWTAIVDEGSSAASGIATDKYDVTSADGPVIAGRDTTVFTAARGGTPVERVFVDDATGLMLRRESYDGSGRPVRSVWFTTMDVAERSGPDATLPEPDASPAAVDDLAHPMRDPGRAGDGFRLIGRWLHEDGVGQLYYSDGVLGVSVFMQPGRLDWSAMPAGARAAEVAGTRAARYALPVGEAWVFERAGIVYTCIGDAPAAEIVGVAADVSAPNESRLDRVAEVVLAPFRW